MAGFQARGGGALGPGRYSADRDEEDVGLRGQSVNGAVPVAHEEEGLPPSTIPS